MKINGIIISLFFASISYSQSDGCTGVPSLTMGSGSCSTTAFSLPGTFSNGGLVNAGCAANNDRDDGWFSFTTGATQTEANIEEVSTNRRHLISVWTACGGGTELGCDQENSGITASLNLTGLIPSTTYYIQIHRRSGNNTASISGTICVWEPVPVPPVIEDCNGGTTVCADGTFTGNSSGSGNVTDLTAANDGCLSGENESSWYYFQASSDGTYEFLITTVVDYDFAVWGPLASVSCPPTGAPLRCSYSGTAGNTGLQSGAGDQTEGSGGDAVVDPITATAGDQFILVIDNYTSDGSSFVLDWTLSGGASLDCTPLPVEMANFEGLALERSNLLSWQTKSESETKEFVIEKSVNGEDFKEIGKVTAAGNSSTNLDYSFEDEEIQAPFAYYRLKMVDFDLSYEYSHTLSISREETGISIFPNPSNGSFNFLFPTNQITNCTVTYLDLTGKRFQEEISLESGQIEYSTEILSSAPSGIYFVEITDQFGTVIEHQKIVIE
jgi:Secretion system C-terminal sorting domain